jgi:hypothetical protein
MENIEADVTIVFLVPQALTQLLCNPRKMVSLMPLGFSGKSPYFHRTAIC